MEQVPCEDTELVLAVLEDRLRTLAHDVVREGERITMFGLGPSPRAINPRDTTVIDVRASDGVTTIDADVSFQASAFLADMRQDTIVLEKLERVFEEMRAEVDFKARRAAETAASIPAMVVPIVESSVPHLEAVRPFVDSDVELRGPEVQQEPERVSAADAVIEPAPAAEPHDAREAVTSTVDAEGTLEPAVEEATTAKSMFLDMPPIKVVASPPSAAKIRIPAFDLHALDKIVGAAEEQPEKTGRIRVVLTAAALTVVAIVGARYFAGWQGGAISEEQPETVAASTSPAPSTVAANTVAAPAPTPSAPAAAPDPSANEDPAEVVKQWEAALDARDAAAQTSFYADPVDRYFLRHDVRKDVVLADKQAAIDKRKSGWTLKMERVHVQRKGEDIANVSLVKHYMVRQDGEPVSEWFVPSRLQLKRADGKWRIVSERDLGWATSLDDLDG